MEERKLVGWCGIAAVGLFGGGSALWAGGLPRPGTSGRKLVRFYERRAERIVAGASLSLLAVALFVPVAAGIRRRLAEAEGDDLLATTAFGGALLGAGAGLAAETINLTGALRARDGTLDPALARALYETSQVLGFNAAGVGIGTFGIATAAVALRQDVLLPRPLAGATAVAGLTLLTPLSRYTFGPSLPLLAVLAARLLREG
jgi:hypothetical protein